MKCNHTDLSIIIVSYNVYHKLIRCINLIKDRLNTEIIIIDNNSTDNTYEKLNRNILAKNITLCKNKTNLGFATAVNQGVMKAIGEKILLLNPDTIPSIESIDTLVNYLKNKKGKIGLIGGKMIKPDTKTIHGTYVNMLTPLIALFDFTNLKKIFPNNRFTSRFYYLNEIVYKPKLVYGLSGGFLLFKKSLINDLGLLDENYFMYLEDVDYGIRARQKGYSNYFVPNASIIHESGSSSTSKYKINVIAWRKSKRYFVNKHFNIVWRLLFSVIYFTDDQLVDFIHRIKKEPLL